MARLGLFQQVIGLGEQLRHLVARGLFGHGHQDVGNVDVGKLANIGLALFAQKRVHFKVLDLDAPGHFALAHPLQHDLAADLAAVLLPGHALFFQTLAHVIDADLIALRRAGQGLLEFIGWHLDTGLPCHIQLGGFINQGFQGLQQQGAAVHFGGGRVGQGHQAVHLEVGDRLVVNHGNDEVQGLGRGGVQGDGGQGGGGVAHAQAAAGLGGHGLRGLEGLRPGPETEPTAQGQGAP